MDITKDNFLNLKYDKYSDVIKIRKEEKSSSLYKLIYKNKLITAIIAMSVICVIINSILIYQFFTVLFNL